jgi:hypothetical protein
MYSLLLTLLILQADFGFSETGAEILCLTEPPTSHEPHIFCASHENQLYATHRITLRYIGQLKCCKMTHFFVYFILMHMFYIQLAIHLRIDTYKSSEPTIPWFGSVSERNPILLCLFSCQRPGWLLQQRPGWLLQQRPGWLL